MDITTIEFWIKIVLSILCGGIIGLERQLKGKPSGIRTSIFICLGTNIFISLGAANSGANVDVTRVLGQVVTGIGFLGAGVIIAREGLVVGITSASVIWVLAGIGSMIGFNHFLEAIVIAVITLLFLFGIGVIENRFSSLRAGAHSRNGDSIKNREENI
ncbi:MAG TPA: MgtC/SapB family protein [Desulfobacteraceae bacterium]|nr:MgtC/SapB family protein [Desulfobacteraceae bacterium]HPJ66471.1 MgtC/SapB family protein [Desulfobacteraceae bacterium]HPQ27998.1 MgtC/SapB family protein [Desulfobacteraceae bacterium]